MSQALVVLGDKTSHGGEVIRAAPTTDSHGKLGDLHYGSKDGEPRIVGKAAEDWLARFDIPEEQLLQYKAKLLGEPQLTPETTLPERLVPPR